MTSILILSPGYPPRVYGGVGSHVHDLATGLVQRGLGVTVVTDGDSLRPEETWEEGVRLVRLRLFGKGPECDELGLRSAVLAGVCRRIAQEGKLDLFHGHDPAHFAMAASVKEAAGLPVVFTQHQTFSAILSRFEQGAALQGPPPPSMTELRRREQRCLEIADGILCVSEVTAAELREAYAELPALWVIPNGVEVGRFSRVDPEQTAKVRAALAAPGEVLVLFVGRSRGVKGLPELIAAAALVRSEVPHVRFAFLLADAEPAALAALRSLGTLAGNCTFRGNTPRQAIPAHYAAADIVAMPSRWEPFGLVAIEAMAAGKPVIVSDVAPLNQIVSDRVDGRVVPRTGGPRGVVDARELAQTITSLARMPASEREAMGLRGRRRVEALYSAPRMVEQTLGAYREILSDAREQTAGPRRTEEFPFRALLMTS